MKPFIINRKSWHYKLNEHFLNDRSHYMEGWEKEHNDFCSYWRVTMIRLILFIAALIVAGCVIAWMGLFIYEYPWVAAKGAAILLSILLMFIGMAFVSVTYEDYKLKKKNEDEDRPESLFAQKYRAYKSKICPMVEYKKD